MNSSRNWRQTILGKIDQGYRESFLREDKTQAQILIAIAAIWVAGFIFIEYQDLNIVPRFYSMLALRFFFISASIWLFWKLPRMNNVDRVDLAILCWSIASVLLATTSNLNLNDITLKKINANLAWVLACYLVLPTRHLYKSIPALLISAFSIYVLFSYGGVNQQEISLPVFLSKVAAMLGMNAIGFLIALRFDSQRYQQYLIQKTLIEDQAQLKELATSDSLTGILNRRSFLEIASTEFDRFQRYGESFSFAIIDVDKLKSINDTYGHPAGDHALVLLTETMKAQKRSSDTVGRLAGDEFGLILPNTNADKALEVMSRIKNALAETVLESPDKIHFQVSFSAGVTDIKKTDDDFDRLYRRADKALLEAKKSGRNYIEKA